MTSSIYPRHWIVLTLVVVWDLQVPGLAPRLPLSPRQFLHDDPDECFVHVSGHFTLTDAQPTNEYLYEKQKNISVIAIPRRIYTITGACTVCDYKCRTKSQLVQARGSCSMLRIQPRTHFPTILTCETQDGFSEYA